MPRGCVISRSTFLEGGGLLCSALSTATSQSQLMALPLAVNTSVDSGRSSRRTSNDVGIENNQIRHVAQYREVGSRHTTALPPCDFFF